MNLETLQAQLAIAQAQKVLAEKAAALQLLQANDRIAAVQKQIADLPVES